MDEDNTKFGDLWELDLTTATWKEVTIPQGSPSPPPRSGHSANIFNGKMYIFGGILELTKELNEMLIYDFKTCQFSIVGSDGSPNADLDKMQSHQRTREEEQSPTLRRNTLNNSKKATMSGASPNKLQGSTLHK